MIETLIRRIPNFLAIITFLGFNSLSRAVLIGFAYTEGQVSLNFFELVQTFLFGFLNDFITLFYFLIPFALFNFIFTQKNLQKPITRNIVKGFYYILITCFCFLVVSEFTFWLEFSTKFNFIAVDYLVYTHEVIGNIHESYPVYIIFPVLFAVSVIISKKMLPLIELSINATFSIFTKIKNLFLITCCATLIFFFFNPKITDIEENNFLSELNKNGLYTLFSAFRHNTLDYDIFYQTIDQNKATNDLFNFIKQDNLPLNPKLLERKITSKGTKKDYNIILIPMESLSSEFLVHIHDGKVITPTLNELIPQSLYFSRIYATGTRTIRGLEAVSLSVPPAPGQSLVRRNDNGYLYSIATILNEEGYDSKYIYGGYGYFDNMNKFFSKNGFKIIDRNDFKDEEITFANIWGVSDEDLYDQVIKQADLSFSEGRKFFSLVMNVSNHRPYTYLEGKIDIAPKSGRHGGVKYADFALGEFIKKAKTKPWFDNTIFVITADHCAGSAGRTALPPSQYRIPLLFYAPQIIKPQTIDKIASQMDVAPTILGLLNISYNSRFFGNDILTKSYNNAFISTFQKLGYIENNKLVILSPGKIVKTYNLLANDDIVETKPDETLINRAISYYQTSDYMFKKGLLKIEAKSD